MGSPITASQVNLTIPAGRLQPRERCLRGHDALYGVGAPARSVWITAALVFYREQHQPEAGYDDGDTHGRKADVQEYCARFQEDQTGKIQDCPNRRSKQAERGQYPRDISRFEKQIKEKEQRYSERYTANVLGCDGDGAH